MADQQSSFIYDVFISFRGLDTRHGFTSHLLKALRDRGIHAFSEDDGDLQKGDDILSSLINAIQDSKIAIIVLSKNYASSSFCLEELAYILDNFQGNPRQLIIPVFYDVELTDVRNARGTYGEALAMHEERDFSDNKQKVQKWRNALHQVANISGFQFRRRRGFESKLIERIVEIVSTRMFDHAPLHSVYTVGLESPLKEVCSLLELDSYADVHMLGIYGATGIGKTTLTREVYNRISHQFEASCFLHDVRENSNIHGLPHLQNMLLSETIRWKDINLQSADKGSSIIHQRLRQKKVLLVLDDVDKLEQLEALVGGTKWFGSGSRVIITTRDRHLLAFHGIERIYEVQPLNRTDALELLSQQIFKEGNAGPSNTEILNELVTYASGLPLALKVIGSYLFGKSVDEWTNALRQFKRVPPEDIQRKLKSSFDALRHDEKRVFLDIACCFKGYELAKVVAILNAHHGYNVKLHIDVLIGKSLVIIGSDDKVRLHPLVEDMGKHIVRQESPYEPGRRSRLWLPEDIVEVLKNNKGSRYTEIIHLDSPSVEDEEALEWDGEAFKTMTNLRTLIIRKCNFSKAPKYLPNSLRVLEWWRYPSHELPSDFNPKHLDICDLPNKGIMTPILADLSEAEKEKLDKDIRSWSSGKEKDIILLLSTLHQIMWPESGWEEVSYMSLKESLQQVKEAYRRAILCLHPDKLKQKRATLIQKYIGEKAFIILQTCQTVPKVSHTSSTVDEVLSQSSREDSPTSMGVLVSQTSQSVPGILSQSSQEGSPTSWSDFVVSQSFQSVLRKLSQMSQEVSPTSVGVLVSQTSQKVLRVLSRSSREVSPTSGSNFVVSQTSQRVPRVLSRRSLEVSPTSAGVLVSETSQRVPRVLSLSSQEVSPTSGSNFVVSQTSQRVPRVLSRRSLEVSPTLAGVLVSETSQRVPTVLSLSSQEVSPTSGSTFVGSQTSQIVPEVSQNSQEVSQASSLANTVWSDSSPHTGIETSRSVREDLQKSLKWRVVGTVSGVVGPLCFVLRPPSKCLIRGWNSFIFFLGWSLVICAAVLFAKPSSFSKKQTLYICYVVFLFISTYSFLYDKAVNGKPGILSVVSNAAFALVSLSLSKLVNVGFETGTFCYFLGCFTIQLLTISWKLIFVAIGFSCPLFLWHFSSDSQPEVDRRGQTIPLWIRNN